jgi:hypothetical protein
VRRSLCGPFTELIVRTVFRRALASAALALAASRSPVFAQTAPAPHPSATFVAPKVPLHVEVFVDTNKWGQVSHVVSMKPSADKSFNTEAYGNAAQAFIRTPNGEAIPGLYRLSYDYNPATLKVRRSVELIRAGGVDPNAPGMVTLYQRALEAARKRREAAAEAATTKLPDFDKITHPSPAH